ncbi:MAG: SDR family NAD(P)-dependent oxidoreductase [Proteobacteria bacterium]|nr:SDR family NAD(P)-dependent oxidoreductase [Pseudomonadota bacterium]
MGLFDGKVVIVTGAGGGLGRAHALSFASEGAKVVVNDLGGTRDGSGAGNAMADQVVAEIREAGGEAVASYDNVATMDGGENITKIALDSFGRIDVLVNNAGILRDKSFAKMEESMWDLVMQVHTKSLYAVSRPVYLHMLDREGGGTIINTSSLAGLLGNYGQTNYATAKAGVAGFTRTLAKEGRKGGIRVNALAPVAKTRMTEDIDMVPDDMTPEHITPMVIYLASELSEGVTGRVFGVHGNQMFEYKMTQTDGVTKDGAEPWTAQEIADDFDAITREYESPAAAAAGEVDEVSLAFAQIPKGFKADAAGSWKTNMHWVIKGASDQTLSIADGKCEYAEGLVGTPTCTVKTDKDTVVGMFSGTIDPTKAFMAGKISADNLGDMMKMGGAFDFETIGGHIAAAMAEAGGGGAAADPVTEAFELLPLGFLPDKAGDWASTFHFVIKGGTDQTMTIGGGVCTTAEGLNGSPTCTIKTDVDTIVGMLEGRIDGTRAFMGGKITADNMGELMKFSTNFRMDASPDEVRAAKATKGGGKAPPPKKAVDLREAIGRTYMADYIMVKEDWIKAFAAATNDLNPRYTEGDVVAPPVFPVRLFHPLMFKCVGDPDLDLDMLRLVHGEQDMTWHGAVRPGDIVNLRGILESVAQKSKGCVIAWRMLGLVDGETRVEARMSVFVRGQTLPGVESGEVFGTVPPGAAGDPEGEAVATATMTVDMDQPSRYAEASLDDNPIHTDESIAKAAGHPTVILHGLCTMSFAARAIVEEVLDRDPSKLHRFGVRFTKPVLPGWELTTRLYDAGTTEAGRKAYQVEVKNQDGVIVAGNGWAEVDA